MIQGPIGYGSDEPGSGGSEDEESGGTTSDGFYQGVVQTDSISTEILLEESVTSGGDSSLWDGTQAEDEDEENEEQEPGGVPAGSGGVA